MDAEQFVRMTVQRYVFLGVKLLFPNSELDIRHRNPKTDDPIQYFHLPQESPFKASCSAASLYH